MMLVFGPGVTNDCAWTPTGSTIASAHAETRKRKTKETPNLIRSLTNQPPRLNMPVVARLLYFSESKRALHNRRSCPELVRKFQSGEGNRTLILSLGGLCYVRRLLGERRMRVIRLTILK